jgi:hypothetical protein
MCALHCLALPLLLPVLPLIGASFVAEHWFEKTILSLSLLIGLVALSIGFFKHHRKWYPILALLGGGIVYWNKDVLGHDFEAVTIALGASLIIAAHLMNLRLCRSCKICSQESDASPAASHL